MKTPPASKCIPCETGASRLKLEQVLDLLDSLQDWTLRDQEPRALVRLFTFRNFHETMAFVNAVAWIAHTQDHHPDLRVTYKTCEVTYYTHAVNGLTENDFICARAVHQLYAQRS